jgi:hypothetical protein
MISADLTTWRCSTAMAADEIYWGNLRSVHAHALVIVVLLLWWSAGVLGRPLIAFLREK